MRVRSIFMILVPLLILVGCRQTTEATAENISVDVALDTENPAVGDATLLVTVTTNEGTAVNDATISVRADMTHAGMLPVIPDSVSVAKDGVYAIPFAFTMGGDWIITVDVVLANGDTTSVEYTIDGVAAEMDMDMDGIDTNSAVSGAYMTITNNGDTDLTLLAVSAEGVGMAQIHETTIDENDMASMTEIESGILIAAGETIELISGALHVMLMNLENDLIEGETITLTLAFDDGSTVNLDVPIVGIAPEESETIEANNLSISAYWARPTALEMDMEATEESE